MNAYSVSGRTTEELGKNNYKGSRMEEEIMPRSSAFLSKRKPENPLRDARQIELQKSLVRELIFLFQGVRSNFFAHDYQTGRYVINSQLDVRICDK